MEVCTKCKIELDITYFNKSNRSKDGKKSSCRVCEKKYRDDNRDILRIKSKERYNNNREDILLKSKEYYRENKEDIKEKQRKYYYDNREDMLSYQIKYQNNNKEKRNRYLSDRRKNDPLFRLSTNVRNLINNSFRNMGYTKDSNTYEIIGCSFEELSLYLESKFEEWMTWENRGLYNGSFEYGWDIDHIIPLSSVSMKEELIDLNHYTNLQPLCSKINRDIKRNLI